jgi:hypothetical protein
MPEISQATMTDYAQKISMLTFGHNGSRGFQKIREKNTPLEEKQGGPKRRLEPMSTETENAPGICAMQPRARKF